MKLLSNESQTIYAGLNARDILKPKTKEVFKKSSPEKNMENMIMDVASLGKAGCDVFLEVLQFTDKTFVLEKLQNMVQNRSDKTVWFPDQGMYYFKA